MGLQNVLPSTRRLDWCIAGGYAACPALAQDIDLWVYGIGTASLPEVVEAIQEHLKAIYTVWELKIADPDEITTRESYTGANRLTIVPVATVSPDCHEKAIHIIVTDADGPTDLVNSFDISTHAVALCPDGSVVTGHYWDDPSTMPRVIRFNGREKTMERYERICRRFGHTPLTDPTPILENEETDGNE